MFSAMMILLFGIWIGLYIGDCFDPPKKVVKKVVDDLKAVLATDWAHCRDEVKAAIDFIEKYHK